MGGETRVPETFLPATVAGGSETGPGQSPFWTPALCLSPEIWGQGQDEGRSLSQLGKSGVP